MDEVLQRRNATQVAGTQLPTSYYLHVSIAGGVPPLLSTIRCVIHLLRLLRGCRSKVPKNYTFKHGDPELLRRSWPFPADFDLQNNVCK